MNKTEFLLVNIGAFITSLGGIFLKRFSRKLNDITTFNSEAVIKTLFNADLLLGGICYIIPIIIWAYLLKNMDLTKLQPLLSLVYIYTIFFSYLFLGEHPSQQRLLGIAFVVIGVTLIWKT